MFQVELANEYIGWKISVEIENERCLKLYFAICWLSILKHLSSICTCANNLTDLNGNKLLQRAQPQVIGNGALRLSLLAQARTQPKSSHPI